LFSPSLSSHIPLSLHILAIEGSTKNCFNSALLNQISFHKIVNISATKIFVTSLGHSLCCKAPSHKFLTNAQCEAPNANLHTTKYRLKSSNKMNGIKEEKKIFTS
jgi:hypothetical protein